METYNSILKYIFPLIILLQYFGCDGYSSLANNASTATVQELKLDCSDFKKYSYNGFYAPVESGKLFVKKGDYNIDSLNISENPIISLNDFKSVSKQYDTMGNPSIQVVFTENGKYLFKEYTTINVGGKIAIIIKDKLITAPIIHSIIPEGMVNISGNFTQAEVDEIYNYLYNLIECSKI